MKKQELIYTPFLMLFYKECMRIWKVVGQTVITPLMNSVLYLLIFGVSLGKSIQLSSGVSYLAFLIPGLVTMSVLNNSFQNSSSTVLNSKFHGDIQDYKVTPLTPMQVVWALSFGSVIRGLAVGIVTFSVSEVFYFFTEGALLPIENPLLLIYFLLAGGLSFGMLGLTVGFWARTFEHVNAVGGFVLLPLIYLGGVFYSLENLHPFWQAVSKANPLLYFINGIRYAVIGVSDVPLSYSVIISILSMFALYYLAQRNVKNGSYQRW